MTHPTQLNLTRMSEGAREKSGRLRSQQTGRPRGVRDSKKLARAENPDRSWLCSPRSPHSRRISRMHSQYKPLTSSGRSEA